MNFEGPPEDLLSEFDLDKQEPKSPSVWAKAMNQVERYKKIMDDPKVREAAKAAARTTINTGITIADFAPGFGDAVSWTADALKFPENTDLTPDVSKKIAIGSEILEAVSGGVAPSHAVETTLQLRHDIPRMKAGYEQLKQLWADEQSDYGSNKADIDAAIKTFDVEPSTPPK